jgi:hypothetical protein
MLPSLPDDFDLFETTKSTTKLSLAPRFSFQGMHHHHHAPSKQPDAKEEANKHQTNLTYFSARMIESAPKLPLAETKTNNIQMRSTAARFWKETSKEPDSEQQ